MIEVPEVRVRAVQLDDDVPVALRDSRAVYDLAIDFSKPPAQIVAALQALFRECIDTGRWQRRARVTEDEKPTPPGPASSD